MGLISRVSSRTYRFLTGPTMFIPTDDRLKIYRNLFSEGVMIAKKDTRSIHKETQVKNLYVLNAMKSLKGPGQADLRLAALPLDAERGGRHLPQAGPALARERHAPDPQARPGGPHRQAEPAPQGLRAQARLRPRAVQARRQDR